MTRRQPEGAMGYLDAQVLGKVLCDLSEADRHEVFETSRLTGEPLRRFWRMCDRQGPVPEAITIMLWRPDVERLARELKREKKRERRRLRLS